MNTIPKTIRDDFERIQQDPSIFPQGLHRETLDFIVEQDDIDQIARIQAGTEITKRDHGIQILCIFPTKDDEDQTGFIKLAG